MLVKNSNRDTTTQIVIHRAVTDETVQLTTPLELNLYDAAASCCCCRFLQSQLEMIKRDMSVLTLSLSLEPRYVGIDSCHAGVAAQYY
jgi:hypothetical protein